MARRRLTIDEADLLAPSTTTTSSAPWLKPISYYGVRREVLSGSSAAGVGAIAKFG